MPKFIFLTSIDLTLDQELLHKFISILYNIIDNYKNIIIKDNIWIATSLYLYLSQFNYFSFKTFNLTCVDA